MGELRQYLLAGVSSIALLGSASAADLPAYPVKAPPAQAVVWSWTGPYVGVNVGAAQHKSTHTLLDFIAIANVPDGTPFWSPNERGVTVGGQIGYNWQLNQFVFGIEGDLNWANAKSQACFGPFCGVPGFNQTLARNELQWYGTLRARAGVTFSQVMLYVTGGLIVAGYENRWQAFCGAAACEAAFVNEKPRTAGVIGGGGEIMLSRNWSAKVEALYADFGRSQVSINSIFAPGNVYSSSFTNKLAVVRGGLNWKW